VGFEPTISAGERPETYALDRAATGTGGYCVKCLVIYDAVRFGKHVSTFQDNL
jgi:hypothetical protein